MPILDDIDSSITGLTIQLSDGRLGIGIIRFGIERLVLIDGMLHLVDSRDIVNQPAICACGRSRWWFDHNSPRCFYCEKPSAEQQERIWQSAHAWFQGRDAEQRLLDVCLLRGLCWPLVQQAAFASRAIQLFERWYEERHP